jgi:hypothetical protein
VTTQSELPDGKTIPGGDQVEEENVEYLMEETNIDKELEESKLLLLSMQTDIMFREHLLDNKVLYHKIMEYLNIEDTAKPGFDETSGNLDFRSCIFGSR